MGILQVLRSEFRKFRILEIVNFHPCSSSGSSGGNKAGGSNRTDGLGVSVVLTVEGEVEIGERCRRMSTAGFIQASLSKIQGLLKTILQFSRTKVHEKS